MTELGRIFGLEPEEEAGLDSIVSELGGEAGIAKILRGWSNLAYDMDGYELQPEDFQDQIRVRLVIKEVMDRSPPNLRYSLSKATQKTDKIFRESTKEVKESFWRLIDSEESYSKEEYWFLYREPAKGFPREFGSLRNPVDSRPKTTEEAK